MLWAGREGAGRAGPETEERSEAGSDLRGTEEGGGGGGTEPEAEAEGEEATMG